jgi:hypothetical protein
VAGFDQVQEPPSTTVSSGPSPQARRHTESAEHDSEHVSVQVMSQVEPSVQVTLLLSPTVMMQVEPPAQSTLHDEPHAPLHSLSSTQSSEQLFSSQSVPSVLHAEPGSHEHDVPLHVGGGVSLPPQATRMRKRPVQR